jgi:hypothetical protein
MELKEKRQSCSQSKKEPRQEKVSFSCRGRELPLGLALGDEREACAREKSRTRRWGPSTVAPRGQVGWGRTRAEPNSARLPLHIASHHPLVLEETTFC